MYPEITEVTQVALEGSPSNAPLLSGAACAGDTQFDWIPAVETDTVPAGMACSASAAAAVAATRPPAMKGPVPRRSTGRGAAVVGARTPRLIGSVANVPATEEARDYRRALGTSRSHPDS